MERSRYYDAEVKIQAALGVHELMWGKSRAHHASIYRVRAAIAIERGKPDEAAQYVDRQMEQLGLRWTVQGEELRQSGLLDRAPDAVPISPWGLDVPSGNLVVLPFRSICSFGWHLYLNAQDEKDPKYAQYLYEAELCFSTALKDSISAHDQMGQMNSRRVLSTSDIELDVFVANCQQHRRALIRPWKRRQQASQFPRQGPPQ